jgi:hypothetical protein
MPRKFSLALGTIAAFGSLTLAMTDSQANPANGLVIRDQVTKLLPQEVGYTYLGRTYPICTFIKGVKLCT